MQVPRTMTDPPKDRRILGFGILGLEQQEGWGTLKWDELLGYFVLDPSEATEFSPEPCRLTAWLELPSRDPVATVMKNSGGSADPILVEKVIRALQGERVSFI